MRFVLPYHLTWTGHPPCPLSFPIKFHARRYVDITLLWLDASMNRTILGMDVFSTHLSYHHCRVMSTLSFRTLLRLAWHHSREQHFYKYLVLTNGVDFHSGPVVGNLPLLDFPGGSSCYESACLCSRQRFDPWSGKIPLASGQLNHAPQLLSPRHGACALQWAMPMHCSSKAACGCCN